MTQNPERKGEVLIFFEVLIWAFFPIITVFSYVAIPSLVSLLFATIFSGIFFLAITAYKGTWKELMNPLLWKYAALATFFIAICFYSLYFVGLTKTTPGNASIIALFEVFTSFLFFNVFKGQKISTNRKLGALLVILGACIVLLPNMKGINAGDFYILTATFFAPAGNYFTQKARKFATSENILFLRSLIAIPFLYILTLMLHMHASASDIRSSFIFLAINGFIIFGLSKLLWVETIHYISVTKAIALSSTGPLLTLLLSWAFLHQMPNVWQIGAVIPMIFGVLLLTDQLVLLRENSSV